MNKTIVIYLVGLLLISGVYAFDVRYSEPTNKDGSVIEWNGPTQSPLKIDCPRNEWNNNFEKYRAGEISKEDMKKYIGGCKW